MIVEFKDVVKEYGSKEAAFKAVDNVSFGIEEGEFVVILGQSGAGKSTVLNMLGANKRKCNCRWSRHIWHE